VRALRIESIGKIALTEVPDPIPAAAEALV